MTIPQITANTYLLFFNQMTDGNSDPVSINYPGKKAVVKIWGTFDGATIKFQTLAPHSNPNVWIVVTDQFGNTNFSGNSQNTLEFLVQNEQVRAVQSGSGGSTTINVSLEIT
jgi:hypothetical protein